MHRILLYRRAMLHWVSKVSSLESGTLSRGLELGFKGEVWDFLAQRDLKQLQGLQLVRIGLQVPGRNYRVRLGSLRTVFMRMPVII